MKWPITFPLAARLTDGIGSIRDTREYRWASKAAIVQLFIGSIVIGINWRILPPRIPLWYSKPWGADRLASPVLLLLPLLSAYLIYHINLHFIRKKSTDHPMFARILLFTSFVVSVVSVALVIGIVMLIR